MKARTIFFVVTAGVLAGCTVGPNYNRPAIAPPDAFRSTTAPSTDPASMADLKWFEVFKDEQLQELVRAALVRNYDVRDAVARIEAARANLGITKADQFPTIDAGASVTAARNSTSGAVSVPAGIDQARTFGTIGASLLAYEVDLWGRLRRATEAARADLLASEHNRHAVLTTMVSDVASAYFNLLELDMELEIAKRTLSVRQDSLTLIRSRERGGLGTLLGVRQGEQLVHGAAQVVPAIEQLIEQTENHISFLLGDHPAAVTRGVPLNHRRGSGSI